MKQNSQKLIFFLSKITCAFAMAIAVLSVNSTCCFTAYQRMSLNRLIATKLI